MKPFIIGIEGESLNQIEIDFLKQHQPWGMILFQRNCKNPGQLRALTDSLKDVLNRPHLPILIDQEGGRVARLEAPLWETYPPFGSFSDIPEHQRHQAIKDNIIKQAQQLKDMGITVNCSPMIDVRHPDSHNIIGDRAFSTDPKCVAECGKIVADTFIKNGIAPIIKHIPGHGRALVDSHEDLPCVTASKAELENDFYPFQVLNYAPLAMTAHILYTDLDPANVATVSPFIIQNIIREKIGFKGLLMTDDLSMKALKGRLTDLTTQSLKAGCDLILHCNGKMDEMIEIASALPFACDMVIQKTVDLEKILYK